MYEQLLSKDIAISALILFGVLFGLIYLMAIYAKLKRRRKKPAIEYGITDFMRQIRSGKV